MKKKKSTLVYTLRPKSLIINEKNFPLFYALFTILWVIKPEIALQRTCIVFAEELLVCLPLHPVNALSVSVQRKGHHTFADIQHRHQADANLLFRQVVG